MEGGKRNMAHGARARQDQHARCLGPLTQGRDGGGQFRAPMGLPAGWRGAGSPVDGLGLRFVSLHAHSPSAMPPRSVESG